MQRYQFTVHLEGLPEMTDDAANALFEAGCDDGSPFSRDGRSSVVFHREARSLEAAVVAAVRDVRRALSRRASRSPRKSCES